LCRFAGSAASLAALVIVLVDKASASGLIDPQVQAWRFVFAAMAIVATGAAWALTYDYIQIVVTSAKYTQRGRIFFTSCGALAGLLVSAGFLDGFFASIYWHRWLGGVCRVVRFLLFS
jgi:hypothetical protein